MNRFNSLTEQEDFANEPIGFREEDCYREDAEKYGLTKTKSSMGYTCEQGDIPISIDSFIASQILGDGSLCIRRNNPRMDGSLPVELSWTHSAKATDYVCFKWHIAKRLGLKPWKITVDNNKNRYSKLPMLKSGISTRDQKWIDMPVEKVAEYLDVFGLLLWYLDDGTLGKRTAVLHSCAFDEETNKKLCEVLKRKFDLDIHVCTEVKTYRNGEVYYHLVIEAAQMRKLIDLVRPYIKYLPSRMLYKLDMKYRYARNPVFYNMRFQYDIITQAPSKIDPENLVEQLKIEMLELHKKYKKLSF